MNSINIIVPYKLSGQWVFDDEGKYLHREAFVSGADIMLDQLIQKFNIKNAEMGFILIFSSTPFPSHQLMVKWDREENGGNWYVNEEMDIEGWLCPALLKYFDTAPPEIYIRVKGQ